MKNGFLILFLSLSVFSYAQDLACSDFKNGTFYVAVDEIAQVGYTIIREGNTQIEIVKDPDNILGEDFRKTSYEIIEWIDDCTYRLRYDESKMNLSEFHQFLNDNNGILVELIKIEGNFFYVKSTLDANGEIQRIDSKICKQ